MRLFRLGLRARLYLGFAVLVASGLGMAAFGMLGLSGVTQSVGRMENYSGNLVRMLDVLRQLEVIEGAANRYRTNVNANSLKDMQDGEAQAATELTDAGKVALSEQRRMLRWHQSHPARGRRRPRGGGSSLSGRLCRTGQAAQHWPGAHPGDDAAA